MGNKMSSSRVAMRKKLHLMSSPLLLIKHALNQRGVSYKRRGICWHKKALGDWDPEFTTRISRY